MSTDFSEGWVNDFIGNINNQIENHIDDIDKLFEKTQSKLWAHFNAFVERVKRKFDWEVAENCIEDKFTSVSPMKD